MVMLSYSCLSYLYGLFSRVSEALSMFLPQSSILFDIYNLFKNTDELPFVNIQCKHQSQLERKLTCPCTFLYPQRVLSAASLQGVSKTEQPHVKVLR